MDEYYEIEEGSIRSKDENGNWIVTTRHSGLYSVALFTATEVYLDGIWQDIENAKPNK